MQVRLLPLVAIVEPQRSLWMLARTAMVLESDSSERGCFSFHSPLDREHKEGEKSFTIKTRSRSGNASVDCFVRLKF